MRFGLSLSLLTFLLGWAKDSAKADDPAALIRAMSSLPLRYAGVVDGVFAGRILLALDEPASDGTVRGKALLMTQDRHPAVSGDVHGTWQPAEVPGGHNCVLEVPLGKQTFTLDGVCSASEVSGALRTRPRRSGWFLRQLFWWDDANSEGRGWLTRSGFYDEAALPPNSY